MRISLKHTGDLPAYRKVFGYVLTEKIKVSNPEYLPDVYTETSGIKQSKFSKFIQKCLEKFFPEYEVETKAQFKSGLKGFVDDKILDKYVG